MSCSKPSSRLILLDTHYAASFYRLYMCVCVGKESNGVLGNLHEQVVTLKHITTESSVIATRSVGVASCDDVRV